MKLQAYRSMLASLVLVGASLALPGAISAGGASRHVYRDMVDFYRLESERRS